MTCKILEPKIYSADWTITARTETEIIPFGHLSLHIVNKSSASLNLCIH